MIDNKDDTPKSPFYTDEGGSIEIFCKMDKVEVNLAHQDYPTLLTPQQARPMAEAMINICDFIEGKHPVLAQSKQPVTREYLVGIFGECMPTQAGEIIMQYPSDLRARLEGMAVLWRATKHLIQKE